MWNVLGFFGSQVVQVLIDRIARMDLVLHAVQSRHHHRGESEIGIACGVRESNFDTARLRAVYERDAHCRRAMTCGTSEVDWRLESRHEALVGVGTGVGDRIERLGPLDIPADIVNSELGQPGITVAGKEVLLTFPDRL